MYHRRLWLGNRTPWLKRRLCLSPNIGPKSSEVKGSRAILSGCINNQVHGCTLPPCELPGVAHE